MNFEQMKKTSPHVVILGAGASCAAIPNGDKYGKKISGMKGFIEKLGLQAVLGNIELLTTSDNLEDIYMELDERGKEDPAYEKAKNELETKTFDYISKYEITDEPTVYDYLLLSLTNKDLVATFNWDPLLTQAAIRVSKITNNLPHIIWLHGTVSMGYCDCKKPLCLGVLGNGCHYCGNKLKPIRLLFPVKNKDYTSDIVISKSWIELEKAMSQAYMVTIFGYSAPVSDVAAVNMLKQAWGNKKDRNLEEIEIINIGNEDEVIDTWSDFIHTHHYSYHSNFFDTTLSKCPRRTCEAFFDMIMNCKWLKSGTGFQPNMKWAEIERLLKPLIDEEQRGGLLTHQYA